MPRPIRVFIERSPRQPLDLREIKYVFRTLLETAGFPVHFVAEPLPGGVDIYYGEGVSDAALRIPADPARREDIREPTRSDRHDGVTYFAFAPNAGAIPPPARDRGLGLTADIVLASFFFLSGWQEKKLRRDSVDFHQIEDSYAYRERLIYDPVVNRYAALIRAAFPSGSPAPTWPYGKSFAAAFTHDVDYPEMIRWIECLRYLAREKTRASLKKLLDIASGRETFWTFPDCIRFEKERGIRTSFYFCGFNRGNLLRYAFMAPDPFYDVGKPAFRELFRTLSGEGFEVGMHSSYLTYRSEGLFREEKARVEASLGAPVVGNRQHYLHLDPEDPAVTMRIHDAAGIMYDSSLGFEKVGGFRRGIASPFHVYDSDAGRETRVLELPPTLMDDQLFGYRMHNTRSGTHQEIDAIVDAVREAGGLFVSIYHPRTMNETFFPGWWDSFAYLVDRITSSRDVWHATARDIAQHWNERSHSLREHSKDELA